MAITNKVLLKVEHLEQFFKSAGMVNKAVNDVNFEIYQGEVFGLVGESGCGKTTTGRSIIRLYDITGGSVYFDGIRIAAGTNTYKEEIVRIAKEYDSKIKELKDEHKNEDIKDAVQSLKKEKAALINEQKTLIKKAVHDHKNCNKDFANGKVKEVVEKYKPIFEKTTDKAEIEKIEKEYKEEIRLAKKDRITNEIQMIFQDPIASLDPRMTVRDIIAEGLVIRGIKDKKYIDEQVYRVLKLVGLVPEHASRYPHEFSGGQRQRIGIARAIVLNPSFIIADEPISALDVSIQAQVITLLNELREKLNLTIMFIAHDLSVVKYFSDRIAVMYYGKIVELASSDELFNHPFHPYTRSLLSAIPLPDPHYEKKRKRIIYNPISDHDYSTDKPIMREVYKDHFVYCNKEEFDKYTKEYNEKK